MTENGFDEAEVHPTLHVIFPTTVSQCSDKATSIGGPQCSLCQTVGVWTRTSRRTRRRGKRTQLLMPWREGYGEWSAHSKDLESWWQNISQLCLRSSMAWFLWAREKSKANCIVQTRHFVRTFCFNLRHVLVQVAYTLIFLHTGLVNLFFVPFDVF